MKLKKAGIGLMCLTTTLTFALAGCGGSGTQVGDKEKGDRVEITFLASVNATSRDSWIELLEAYNDGVGYEEDGVYVTMKNGNGSPSSNYFTQSVDYACNVIAVNDSQNDNGLQALMITRDSRRAPDGLFVDLTPYAEADEDFKNNTISEQALNWGRMTYNPDAAQGAGAPKHVIGAGQNLMAVPYGVDPHFNWYNAALFKAQGINIISCPEEELPEEYPNVQPHGYAEYKNAPFDGATSSKTLDGRTVYKVFNDCIGMNWEEMRYLLKYFSKEWNPSSTSNYGFVSEYWFNYGWSVGGDVMGFNGTDYDFTLLDKSPNYIVTKDGTVINGNTYSAGEIVLYEDRVNEKDISSMDGVYAIESQYNAVKEYVSLQIPRNNSNPVDIVDGVEYKGYGVANPDTGSSDNWFNTEQIAMVRGKLESINDRLRQDKAANFDICPCETYREYVGGSVYYDGEETIDNEYLKVIGEEYDGEVYTGELKVVDGTPIVGNSTTASISEYLVIPACSDPEKYQAAWDFISWVATEGQQYIAKNGTVAPAAKDVLFSDAFAYNEEINRGKNYYAVAMMANNTGRGDWGYFESGQWVTNWANDFNGYVRRGTMTLSEFSEGHGASAKEELNNMYCVIKGIR